jgi:hypothetical protein
MTAKFLNLFIKELELAAKLPCGSRSLFGCGQVIHAITPGFAAESSQLQVCLFELTIGLLSARNLCVSLLD